MSTIKFSRLLLGGLFATVSMTLLMYLVPLFGFPPIDSAGAIATLWSDRGVLIGDGNWWGGMAVHLALGVLLVPLLYQATVVRNSTKYGAGVGAVFGVMLYFLIAVVALPALGFGLFARLIATPILLNVGLFFSSLLYGAVLGSIARPRRLRLEPASVEIQRVA